jgi:hypothetical protein
MRIKALFYAVGALPLLALATSPHPAAELARAHTLVDQAEQAGAQQFASSDLEAARNKLQRAEGKHTDRDLAVRLADEAAVDAEVAAARTRAAKAQSALTQVNAGTESLRHEATTHSDQNEAAATEQSHDNK